MAIRHNNAIPNVHYRKWWQRYVRTWFNQAGRKKSRRVARQQKAAKVFPRPVALLRPVVHPPTQRYNYKLREGRGFTLSELKAAGIPKKKALTIGIAMDHRRKNWCEESLKLNADRLKEYMGKLMVFPRKTKAKKGDTPRAQCKDAKQNTCKTVLPIKKTTTVKKTKAEKMPAEAKDAKYSAFRILRKAIHDRKLKPKREKAAKAKADKAAAK